MRVSVILGRKGAAVATIPPDATVAQAAQALADHDIGALVVSGDGQRVEGMLSERDIVRGLARDGHACLEEAVHQMMTDTVAACSPETTVDELMAMMTNKRIRHVPVIVESKLAGIVSIGDVVKSRLDELEVQANTLQQYVTGSPT